MIEGTITADTSGQPYVILPVALYMSLFDQLRQGMVGIVQLRPAGDGAWALDIAAASEADEIAAAYRSDEPEEGSDE